MGLWWRDWIYDNSMVTLFVGLAHDSSHMVHLDVAADTRDDKHHFFSLRAAFASHVVMCYNSRITMQLVTFKIDTLHWLHDREDATNERMEVKPTRSVLS